jgi:4-amino-4-deoxy-L-arabinose transferase-like glycosyltransferase
MIERAIRWPGAILLVLVLYGLFLWKMSVPMTGDQKVYLSIALEMKERGEWIIPYLFGRANFLKPPLQYWATLIGWNGFGFNLFGALIPSVLAMIAAGWVTRRIAGSRNSVTFLFFCSTLSTMTYGTTGQMEIWIVLFYATAWLLWLEGRTLLAWIVTGMMSLVKGPLYPALWVFTVILHQGMSGKKRELLKPRFGMGLILGIGIGLFWYGLAARTHLQEMLNVFLLRENVGKLSTPQGSPLGLWSEFLGTLFPLLPWLILSLASTEFRVKWQKNRVFWISFGLFPAAFFTFFPYRVNTYLYLLAPLAVWMMADETPTVNPRLKRGVNGGVALIALVLAVLGIRLYAGAWMSALLTGAFLISLGFWLGAHLKLKPSWVAVSSLLLVSCIRLAAIEIGEWDIQGLRAAHRSNPAPLAYWIDREDIWHEFGLVSAALSTPISRLKFEEERNTWVKSGNLLILSDEQDAIAQGLKCVDWVRLKKRLKFPLTQLFLKGLSIEDSTLHRIYHVCQAPSS